MQTPEKAPDKPHERVSQVPLDVIRENFLLYDMTPNKKRINSRCKWCQQAFDQDPNQNPPAALLRGRRETWTRHLKNCSKYQEDTREVEPFVTPAAWSASHIATFQRYLVEFQQYHKLPDTYAQAPITKRLWDFMTPGVSRRLPSRKQLGGVLLATTADAFSSQDKTELLQLTQALRGRVNLVSDGWMAINRNHVNAFQLTMFGKVHTYVVLPVGSRHDAVVMAKQIEEGLMQAVDEGWSIGVILTDDAGQCGRARRILILRWPNIVFMNCFAHSMNNIVKAVLKAVFKDVASQAAKVVNTLHASSSKWLHLARGAIRRKYSVELSFLALCETRWKSMQACFASLLRVRTALKCFGWEWQDDPDFPPALEVLVRPSFWEGLEGAELAIRPLSKASYMLQRDQTTVADVTASYRSMYESFSVNKQHASKLLQILEARWEKCEQPLLLLGFYLHPVYAKEAFDLPDTDISGKA